MLESARPPCAEGFHFQVVDADGFAAPRTVRQLQWCTFTTQTVSHAMILAEGFGGIFRPVGCGFLTDPQANAEGFLAPFGVIGAA
jgi:hypothetical protein